MGWPTATKVLLMVLVFSKWPLTTDTLLQESSLAGMPLSDVEYEYFFRTLTARQALHAACFRRAKIGCEDPAIQALDRYENHGIIPDGWICSDFPDNTSFPGFCEFALYRCIMKKYFAKRVLCPSEIKEKSAITQNNRVIPDNIVLSTKELHNTTATTTSTESSPEDLTTVETAATETAPMSLPSTSDNAKESNAKEYLVMLKKISSAIKTTTKLISQLLAAFTAPSSELATANTTTAGSLIELTSSPAIVMEPALHPATTTSELVATLAEPTPTTTTAPTQSSPNLATATEFFPESTSAPDESFFEPTTHTTATATTEPCIVDYPEPLSTSTTPTLPTATTPTSSSSPATIFPNLVVTRPTKAVATSSVTTATPQTFVPSFPASFPFPSPQRNSTMHVLILSFRKDKTVKPGDMLGISVLPHTGVGSGNILHQEEVRKPLPVSGLKNYFLQLRDKRVQQVMNKIQNTMPGGKQKPQSQSHALQLLNAHNSRSNFKSGLQR